VEREQREHVEKQKQMLKLFLERQVRDRKIQEAQEREKVREQDLLVSMLTCERLSDSQEELGELCQGSKGCC
jgi:hypothetical protein